MAREIINVGTAPNDGLGDPLRTAYIKCNNNFAELYSRAQSVPPASLVGTVGDQAGMYAYDPNVFYYCYQDYDGSSEIWGQVSDFQPTTINNGTSNVRCYLNSNVTVSVGNVANVATFTTNSLIVNGGISFTGNLSAVGNVSGTFLVGNTVIGNNIGTTGNVIAALVRSTDAVITGNIDSGNLRTTGSVSATGNITGGNLTIGAIASSSTISASGNVTGGNIRTAGQMSATGNISGNYLFGDGSFLINVPATSNVAATQIANGTSIIRINGTGGSALIQVGGVANVAVFTASGEYISGLLDVTGNATVGNLNTSGLVSATGNVSGGNITTASVVSAGGNVVGGNIRTGGVVSATGNVTGNYILGNGAFLSGVITSVANINSGTSNVTVTSAGGPVSVGVGGVANVSVFTATGETISGNLLVTGNIDGGNIRTTGLMSAAGGIAGATWFSPGNIDGGNVRTSGQISATGNITGGNVSTSNYSGTTASITGNINSGNLRTVGSVSATGNIIGNYFFGNGSQLTGVAATTATALTNGSTDLTTSLNGNANVTVSGSSNVAVFAPSGVYVTGVVSATGAVTTNANLSSGGNISATGNVTANILFASSLLNTGANGVGNIGTSTGYFNTVFAKATSAQYADLAERYLADQPYPPGTVLKFGDATEVTLADLDHDSAVAGVVSSNPAFVMNTGLEGDNVVVVALMGRTLCRVRGPVRRGQMMVSAGDGFARAEQHPAMGTVIGKSLEHFDGEQGEIEILVGRL